MQKIVAEVRGLNIAFPDGKRQHIAVNDAHFVINENEIVAIVGESGSGKSVTALSIMGLNDPKAIVTGEILLADKNGSSINTSHFSAKQYEKIRGKTVAMIFQEPMTSLNPLMTCGEQVIETIMLHEKINRKQAREKTLSLFKKVSLPTPEIILKKYPHELSGGQKQRVMIAIAISCNPQLLIADEPTTALDVTVQKSIIHLIKALQLQHKMSVLFISHDLGLVADIADKIIVMYKGNIVEYGNCNDVLNHPKHIYTKALLACRSSLQHKTVRLPVVDEILNDQTIEIKKQIVESPTIETTPILTVKDLTVTFTGKRKWFNSSPPDHTAVNKASLQVNKGEIVGIVGESGCGKTTLGKAILGLILPTAGDILFNGKIVDRKNRSITRKEMQIVFQDPYGSLNPKLTIGEAIEEPMKVHHLSGEKKSKDRVIELLEKVQLKPEHFYRYPHQFSGGQRQRICIARALALEPSFLIFDESVSALDISVQAQVLNLINDLKHEFNFSALFISHDLSVVHYISDRIIVMKNGSIIEEGDATSLFNHPRNEETRILIDSIPGKQLLTQ